MGMEGWVGDGMGREAWIDVVGFVAIGSSWRVWDESETWESYRDWDDRVTDETARDIVFNPTSFQA